VSARHQVKRLYRTSGQGVLYPRNGSARNAVLVIGVLYSVRIIGPQSQAVSAMRSDPDVLPTPSSSAGAVDPRHDRFPISPRPFRSAVCGTTAVGGLRRACRRQVLPPPPCIDGYGIANRQGKPIPRFRGKALQTLVFASQRAPRSRACSQSIHRDD
jgi:hypothetical protein